MGLHRQKTPPRKVAFHYAMGCVSETAGMSRSRERIPGSESQGEVKRYTHLYETTGNSADSSAMRYAFCHSPRTMSARNETTSKAVMKKIAGSQSCANCQKVPLCCLRQVIRIAAMATAFHTKYSGARPTCCHLTQTNTVRATCTPI